MVERIFTIQRCFVFLIVLLSLPSTAFSDSAFLRNKLTLDGPQQVALRAALSDKRFVKHFFTETNKPFRCEVFGVYNVQGDKYRVELYNYGLNLSTIGYVDGEEVVEVQHFSGMQPDIPLHLVNRAVKIAVNDARVASALGVKPDEADAIMESTKTALNGTRCERSQQLCVAPTFVKGDRALWVIVNLTVGEVAGIRWTNVGKQELPPITERSVQDSYVTEEFCEKTNSVERNGWKLSYRLTSSDGLEIMNVAFKDDALLKSAKLVDWHVSYSKVDGFGYSDAVGCPVFSQAAVIAHEPPEIRDLKNSDGVTIGFVLEQEYFNHGWPAPCNYNYLQQYEFYFDGRFRIKTASIGRGCGLDGVYRPVFRIALSGDTTLSEWEKESWKVWDREQWALQSESTDYYKERYQYRIERSGRSPYLVEPSVGQFGDGGRGDNAFLYLTKGKDGEGEKNLITLGPCCNTDYQQGPEKFIEPEELSDKGEKVLWYVPMMQNDGRKGREYCWAESVLVDGVYETVSYPCFVGPMFVPEKDV